MACRSVLKAVMRSQPWQSLSPSRRKVSVAALNGCGVREIQLRKKTFCSDKGTPIFSMLCNDDPSQNHPKEAVIKSISQVSKIEGRIAQTPNVIIGGNVTDTSADEWLELDQAVNTYPMLRGFTAIGTGGDDFIKSMIIAVESVIQQPIPEGHVRQKVSSKGKYVSVHIGPIHVVSSEQVRNVYNAMKKDDRMKFFL